jgi:hypothetical protein
MLGARGNVDFSARTLCTLLHAPQSLVEIRRFQIEAGPVIPYAQPERGSDLDGLVAKRKDSLYRATEKSSPYWVKIKNRNYTQAEGREELFDPARKFIRATEIGV